MKISDRDKLLILGVLLIAIIALPIFLFIRPKIQGIKDMEAQLVTLNDRYNYLKDLQAKQPFYESEITRLNEERTDLIEGFAEGLKQENTIMFLRNIEKTFPLNMYSETFSVYEETPVTEGYVNPETGKIEGDLTALKTSTTVTYRCDYEQLKHLLDYIYSNDNKMNISTLTVEYNRQMSKVEGTFTFDEFAFIGEGRDVETLPIPNLDHGHNTNPFALFEIEWVDEFGERIDGQEAEEVEDTEGTTDAL